MTTHELIYDVRPFNPAVDVSVEVADFHLGIRRYEVLMGENTFTDIEESWRELQHLEEAYLAGKGNFFIAKDTTTAQLVGCVGLKDYGDGVGSIRRMGVLRPEYERRGIATSLMHELMGWARSNDFSMLTLVTGEAYTAKPLYEKFGFREVGRLLRNRDYLMELVLK